MNRVSTEPVDLARCIERVSDPSCGAVATFLGMVRDHHGGHPVERLEYEAYAPMAVRELDLIAGELASEFGVAHVAIEHRVGKLAIGDVAMAIAVSAAHRGAAFAAITECVDRIKQRVPIWKKEFYADGTASWVGRDGSIPEPNDARLIDPPGTTEVSE